MHETTNQWSEDALTVYESLPLRYAGIKTFKEEARLMNIMYIQLFKLVVQTWGLQRPVFARQRLSFGKTIYQRADACWQAFSCSRYQLQTCMLP